MPQERYICPVCGYPDLYESPYSQPGCPSYEICPCCGTEFGLHDVRRSHAELRAQWLLTGALWHHKSRPPAPGWSAHTQLAKAGLLPQKAEEGGSSDSQQGAKSNQRDELSNPEVKAWLSLEAARAALPSPLHEHPSAIVRRLESWLNAKSFNIHGGQWLTEFRGADVFVFAYEQLEELGEVNECSPQFWQYLAAAAEEMQEALVTNVARKLDEVDRHLRRLETNFEGVDILSRVQSYNTDFDTLKAHYFRATAHSIARFAADPQRALRHNRMPPQQREQYFSLLRRFKVFLPELEKRGIATKEAIMREVVAAMRDLEP